MSSSCTIHIGGRRIGVLCDALPDGLPGMRACAVDLARALVAGSIGMVCRGDAGGTSEVIAREMAVAEGHVSAIAVRRQGDSSAWIGNIDRYCVATDTQNFRQLFYDLSDGYIALPGGAFVMEALMELATWVQKGRVRRKPVYLVNLNGYWDPLLAMFEHMRAEDFLPEDFDGRFRLVSDPSEAVLDFRQRLVSGLLEPTS